MAHTTTTNITPLMKTYYDKTLMHFAKATMVMDQFADKSRDIPQNEGKVCHFNRMVPLDLVTSTVTEGSNPGENYVRAVGIEKTLEKYGNTVSITELLDLTALDHNLDTHVMLLGENMGQSVDRLYKKLLATDIYPLRVDNSTTYAVSGVEDAAVITTIVDAAALTQADYFWDNGSAIFTSGKNAGIGRICIGFANSGDVATFATTKVVHETGDTFRIVTSQGITAADTVTASSVNRAVALLKKFKAPRYDGKYFIGVISPAAAYDFMEDSAWVNAAEYAGSADLYSGEIGRWGGVRWVEDTEDYLERPCDTSTYDATLGFGLHFSDGTIHRTPIFGKHCYAGTRIAGVPDKLIIKVSGPQDTSNPTNAYSKASWRIFFVPVVLNGLFGVSLISGASTVA